jgi:H+/Cl- antiporter ClcA
MSFAFEKFSIVKYAIRWTMLILPVAITTGSIVAAFLWILTKATHFRFEHSWLLFLLPLAGIIIHLIYQSIGKSSEKGNNLILDEIFKKGHGIPWQMTPVIFITTILTHLFGGSAGREGTAVQIGGSIAGMFGKWWRLNDEDTKIILTAGIAAGFGAVFGTPVTGAIFSLEVLAIGRMKYNSLLPALMASVIGDLTVAAWQVKHTAYHIDILSQSPDAFSQYFPINLLLLTKVILASALFGLASYLFVIMTFRIKRFFNQIILQKWLIPVLGGFIIIGLTFLLGKTDYLGLGVDPQYNGVVTISSAFQSGGSDVWSWLWKMVFTAVTLGTGFKGGEVTPLFYIGATLGNSLSLLLDAPVGLFAALGFIAVFAGATNTPLACTIMGVELFGSEYLVFFAVACFTSYLFSGHTGIYSSQRVWVHKINLKNDEINDIS